MPDYEKLYHFLFNAVTDAVELMPGGEAREMLIEAQRSCEEIYIASPEDSAGDGIS